MKQKEIFESICACLKSDKNVSGIMLMGSVARGIAALDSDLDIMIFAECDKFFVETIDGILVEYIYITHETAMKKLENNGMEVYHYLGNHIVYDKDCKLAKLMAIAVDKYNNFVTDSNVKKQISHWLLSTKIKLHCARNANDIVKINFLTATNSWKVIEAIWAVNNKPVPPSSSIMWFKDELSLMPFNEWYKSLFTGGDIARSDIMLQIIDWVLSILDKQRV